MVRLRIWYFQNTTAFFEVRNVIPLIKKALRELIDARKDKGGNEKETMPGFSGKRITRYSILYSGKK